MSSIIIDAVRGAAREVLGNKAGLSREASTTIADQVAARLEAKTEFDPKLKNALSLESLFRSRVANGSSGAIILACLIAYMKWKAQEFDEVFLMALGVILTAGYALAGRALNWSGPMWSRLGRWISDRFQG